MLNFVRNVRRHRHGDEGASAVEYGLLVAAIAAVIVVVVFALGTVVKGKISKACDNLNTQGNGNSVVASASCK